MGGCPSPPSGRKDGLKAVVAGLRAVIADLP